MRKIALFIFAALALSGCIKVGPDFVRPVTKVSDSWFEARDERVTTEPAEYRDWWRLFEDPVLDRLIDSAYRQNLPLQIAGVRVLEARARLGIEVGGLYPQSQQAIGSLQYNRLSQHSTIAAFSSNVKYAQDEIGLTASWELDFWGGIRRGVESAGASLIATMADYDNALVSLTSSVANSYILIKTLEKRIVIARQNVETQRENLRIAEARFRYGTTSERDVQQAMSVLSNTQASIPSLDAQLQQARHALSQLLGLPPGDLTGLLAGPAGIPVPPARIAIGIPADLLRRRPDIRSAEYQAMAQGAQIGVARAQLFPAFFLNGTFTFTSTNVAGSSLADMFTWGARSYVVGPSAQWNLFNYGRIVNNIRVQDARFQELIMNYQNAVLKAQQEVEDGLVAFLRFQEQAQYLAQSTEAAKRSLDLAVDQYREGITDFTTVLVAEQTLLGQQDNLAVTLGNVAANMVAVYRAIGGGWQIREGMDVVSPEVKATMARRTNWGDLLTPAAYIGPASRERLSSVGTPDW